MVPVRQRASIILTLSHYPPHFTLNLLLHATLWGPRVTTPGSISSVPTGRLARESSVSRDRGAEDSPASLHVGTKEIDYTCGSKMID